MQSSVSYLLFQNEYSVKNQFLILNQVFPTVHSLPIKRMISFQNEDQQNRIIYLYNPTDQRRIEIIKILVDTHRVRVTSNNSPIETCQIHPKWFNKQSNFIVQNQFKV